MTRADGDEFSFEAFSLDATVFEVNGTWYYIWAEKVGVGRQISNLYIARMKNGYTLDSVQVLLTTPDYDWERPGLEYKTRTGGHSEGRQSIYDVFRQRYRRALLHGYDDGGGCRRRSVRSALLEKSAIRYLHPVKKRESTARDIIPSRRMRREMTLWSTMRERRQRDYGRRCTIQPSRNAYEDQMAGRPTGVQVRRVGLPVKIQKCGHEIWRRECVRAVCFGI